MTTRERYVTIREDADNIDQVDRLQGTQPAQRRHTQQEKAGESSTKVSSLHISGSSANWKGHLAWVKRRGLRRN